MSKLDEMIIVAPRRDVFADEAHVFQGFVPLADPRAEAVLRGLCAAPRTARRGDVEDDPSLKQPIPYVVLTRAREGGEPEVFAYLRLAGGGEARLHGRMSIGVGGHMNRGFQGQTLRAVVAEEAARELSEELRFRDGTGAEVDPPAARLVGVINDDSGPVQQVHLGLLAVAELPTGVQVDVRETEQLDGQWLPLSTLSRDDHRARLEQWSLHALAAIE